MVPGRGEKMVSDNEKSSANAQIRKNLQRVYDEALEEEIPSEFIEMIERLSAQKRAQANGK